MATWGDILKEIFELQSSGVPLPPGIGPLDLVRRKYLAQLSAYTGRSTILYSTKWVQPGVDPDLISITPEDIQGFMEVIHGLPSIGLDLILHSPGGSAESAEALVLYLRSKFDDIRVIIPHAAMSAACMIACSANRIVMGNHSFLGPIDPQFIVDTPLGRRVAAAHAILEQFQLAQQEAANPQKLGSWLPILQQYGPALIVQCKLAQQLSEELVASWLERYMFARDQDAKSKAKTVAAALADHGRFKSHGRFIPRAWALDNGLVVDSLETDQKFQDTVLSVFHATNHTFNATPAAKIIENNLGKAFIKNQPILMGPQVMFGPQLPSPIAVPQPVPPAVVPERPK